MAAFRYFYFCTFLCMLMGCSVTHDIQKIQSPDVERQAGRDEQSTLDKIAKTHSGDVLQDAQNRGNNTKDDHTATDAEADDGDARQSLEEESDEREYISNYYDSCNLKNPKKVRLLSKHQYALSTVHQFKVINNYVFVSSKEYNHWFLLDDTTDKMNILRGYWGIANDKYIYSHIDDFWIYDYKNNKYVWKNKFKGYYDEGITSKYLYITHKSEDEDGTFYYLDKRKLDGELLWTKKLPEIQLRSTLLHFFVVWRDHIIVGMEKFFLASVNAKTGEIEWKRDYDQCQDENYCAHNVRSLNRPVYVDPQNQRILFDYRGFTCVDMNNGDVLWTYDREKRQHLSILAVYDGMAYVSDLGASPLIIALDTLTGEELWRYAENGDYDFRSLFVTEDHVIFGNPASSIITALDRKTGTLAWKLDLGHDIIVGWSDNALVCHGNKLFVASDEIYVFEVLE